MGELVIIFAFILAATMMSYAFGLKIHQRHIAYKERRDMLNREAQYGSSEMSQNNRAKLEERVRVLERIATDGKQDLALQIEELRDLDEIDSLVAPTTREKA